LEPYVGQKLTVQVMEVNPRKRNLVVSRRACLEAERKEAADQLWQTLEVGQRRAGRVKTMKDYGAFIDIGGADGFLHIGEISWQRIRHPGDALREGQEVEVSIIGLDPEKKKISLGMRQLMQNPWVAAAEKYCMGSGVSGTVTRTTEFGAFIQLEPGIEGLVHISELDHKRVKRVTDVLQVGQTVEAQVLEADPVRRRISLSLKACKPAPEAPKDEDFAPSKGQSYERKRKSDLKGGTGAATTGGGLFGDPRNYKK
jgi:small subunit ribosomal protein S1